jgi:hypothetical protein
LHQLHVAAPGSQLHTGNHLKRQTFTLSAHTGPETPAPCACCAA